MENLPSDILREIFDLLDPNWDDYSTANYWLRIPKRYKHAENRRDLSDLARLRLVCKRFSSLGAPYLFRCVVQRFNRESFRRLECLAEHPELGNHVKQFVYLMPYLYVKGILHYLVMISCLCLSLCALLSRRMRVKTCGKMIACAH